MCLINIGSSYNLSGRYEEAHETLAQALVLCPDAEPRGSEAMVLNNLAVAFNGLGRYADAARQARRAAAIFRDLNEPARLAYTLETEADAYAGQGDLAGAIAIYQDALHQAEQAGVTTLAVAIRRSLGKQLLADGRSGEARAVWTEALHVCVDRGDPEADHLRALLARLDLPTTSHH